MNFITLPFLGVSAFVASLTYYIASSFFTWYRLRHVPGPFLASFSYLWLARNNLFGVSNAKLRVLHKKYGSIVRVGPNYVLTDGPSELRRISGPRSKYGRDPGWWTGLRIDPREDNMLTTLDIAAHDHLKAQTANGYNGRDKVDIETGVDDQIVKLKALIRRCYLLKEADLIPLIRYFTLDVVTVLAYGQSFGYLDANEDIFGFNKQVQDMTKPMGVLVDTPIMRTLVNSPLAPHIMPKHTDKAGMGRLIGFVISLITKVSSQD